MGTLFLLLGLATGPGFHYFYAYLALGTICLARAFLIYQYRRKISRRNRITILTKTQKIERNTQ